MSATIGFIGTGNMGLPMARNLLKAGFSPRVYNRTAEKARPLAEQGAQIVGSPAETVEPGGIVITMLANDAAVESVVMGEGGFLDHLGPSGIHLSMSTIAPATVLRLVALHEQRGSLLVSAPVFGRPEAAEARKLWIAEAGPRPAKERVRPVLEALGQGIFDFGETQGAANVVKLCGNFMLVAAMEAMAETSTLAEKNGVPRTDVMNMLTQTLFACGPYQNYGKAIAEERYTPAGFKLVLGLKDVTLALQTATDARMPMPLASLVHDRMMAGMAKGREDMDWSALALGVSEDAGLAPKQ
jgi:3-hydroxyisobutyrate dehydrogenase-like beta-hydroxyacid dehydrogenase